MKDQKYFFLMILVQIVFVTKVTKGRKMSGGSRGPGGLGDESLDWGGGG